MQIIGQVTYFAANVFFCNASTSLGIEGQIGSCCVVAWTGDGDFDLNGPHRQKQKRLAESLAQGAIKHRKSTYKIAQNARRSEKGGGTSVVAQAAAAEPVVPTLGTIRMSNSWHERLVIHRALFVSPHVATAAAVCVDDIWLQSIQSFVQHTQIVWYFPAQEQQLSSVLSQFLQTRGVLLRCATQLMPMQEFQTYCDSKIPLQHIKDLLQFRALRALGGFWADLDVLCLKRDLPTCDGTNAEVILFSEYERLLGWKKKSPSKFWKFARAVGPPAASEYFMRVRASKLSEWPRTAWILALSI